MVGNVSHMVISSTLNKRFKVRLTLLAGLIDTERLLSAIRRCRSDGYGVGAFSALSLPVRKRGKGKIGNIPLSPRTETKFIWRVTKQEQKQKTSFFSRR